MEAKQGGSGSADRVGAAPTGGGARAIAAPEHGRRLRPTTAIGRHVRVRTRADERPEHLFRRLLGAYLGGATSYEVVQRPRLSPFAREAVRSFVQRTGSAEVAREDRTSVVLVEDAVTVDEAPLPRLLGLGQLVVRAHRRAVRTWDDLPTNDAGNWQELDNAVDQKAWQLQRSIVLGLAEGPVSSDSVAFWTVARALERIGDEAVVLGQLGPLLAGATENLRVRPTLQTVRQLHEQALRLLAETLTFTSARGANELLDALEALASSCRTVSDDLLMELGRGAVTPVSAVAADRALAAVTRTLEHAAEIVQVAFDRATAEAWDAPPPGALPARSTDRHEPASEVVLGR